VSATAWHPADDGVMGQVRDYGEYRTGCKNKMARRVDIVYNHEQWIEEHACIYRIITGLVRVRQAAWPKRIATLGKKMF